MSNKLMWFATREFGRWIPCPDRGADAERVGYTERIDTTDGGVAIRNSHAAHKEYNFSWNLKTRSEVDVIDTFASGVYGEGDYYFYDPTTLIRNVLPEFWSTPQMGAADAPTMVRGKRPELTRRPPSETFGYPLRSALITYSGQDKLDPLYVTIPPNKKLWVGGVGDNDFMYAAPIIDGVTERQRPVVLGRDDQPVTFTSSFRGDEMSGIELGVQDMVNTPLGRNLLTHGSAELAGLGVPVYSNNFPNPNPTFTDYFRYDVGGNTADMSPAQNAAFEGGNVMRTTWTDVMDDTGWQGVSLGTSYGNGMQTITFEVMVNEDTTIDGLTVWNSTNIPQVIETSHDDPTLLEAGVKYTMWATYVITNTNQITPALQVAFGGTKVEGLQVDIGTVQLYEGGYNPARKFITGNPSGDPDLVAVWAGVANRSQSRWIGTRVAGVTGINCEVIRSSVWRKDGNFSMRVIPTSVSNDTYFTFDNLRANPALAASGTLMGVVYADSLVQPGQPSFSRSIVVRPVGAIASPATPLGEETLRLHYTNTTPTVDSVRFYHGGNILSGDVWWDVCLFTDDIAYSGAAANGNSRGWIWDEVANASTSTYLGQYDITQSGNVRHLQAVLTDLDAPAPTPRGFMAGNGHSGCMMVGRPTETLYESQRGLIGKSVKLVETWIRKD